ncbi:hypothetical protein Glove_368g5 [Diversispora epigaea]|uniref:Protein kinase domain-containing protein n=1 Tax=Diversispora epigaea TaxID=1348612 RepID=A0A397HB19_9GLOM|nr:hypothetical protein Glove_368g5 [Diversispora epigaea]
MNLLFVKFINDITCNNSQQEILHRTSKYKRNSNYKVKDLRKNATPTVLTSPNISTTLQSVSLETPFLKLFHQLFHKECVEYIAKGGFNQIYKATWRKTLVLTHSSFEACLDLTSSSTLIKLLVCLPYKLLLLTWTLSIDYVVVYKVRPIRMGLAEFMRQKRNCVLKVLNNSKNVDTKFSNESPKTKNYAFILDFAPNGDLNHSLRKNFNKSTSKPQMYGVTPYMEDARTLHLHQASIV